MIKIWPYFLSYIWSKMLPFSHINKICHRRHHHHKNLFLSDTITPYGTLYDPVFVSCFLYTQQYRICNWRRENADQYRGGLDNCLLVRRRWSARHCKCWQDFLFAFVQNENKETLCTKMWTFLQNMFSFLRKFYFGKSFLTSTLKILT